MAKGAELADDTTLHAFANTTLHLLLKPEVADAKAKDVQPETPSVKELKDLRTAVLEGLFTCKSYEAPLRDAQERLRASEQKLKFHIQKMTSAGRKPTQDEVIELLITARIIDGIKLDPFLKWDDEEQERHVPTIYVPKAWTRF